MLPTPRQIEQFWARIVKQPSGCWFYTGPQQQFGYGRIVIDGIMTGAHRLSWFLANGPIPTGKVVCHRCNNPPCVNPAHLFLGTQRENMLHRQACGRTGKLPDHQWRRLFVARQPRGRTVEQRFWNFVKKTDSCWLWTGSKSGAGYGSFSVNKTSYYAHRYSWELHRGPIPEGMYLLHYCPGGDNPSCCNPDHLRVGTPKENSRDAVNKGRMKPQAETFKRLWRDKWGKIRSGENNPRSKLTTVQVIEMRRLHAEEGWGYKRLRKHFGVSFGVAQRIINRKAWKLV